MSKYKLVWWKCGIWLVWAILLHLQTAKAWCVFPPNMTRVFEWSSEVKSRGNILGRSYFFGGDRMNVSINTGSASREHYFKCHQVVTFDSYIIREETSEGNIYKCVKLDQWSPNVIVFYESQQSTTASESLCREENLVRSEWPLIWQYLDYGYISCPDIGGFNIEVLDATGESFCAFINPSKHSRLESECIYGEGLTFDFSVSVCKGDMPLARSEKLLCLGHKTIGNDTHIILTNNDHWPRFYSIRYRQQANGSDMSMYFSNDVRLNLTTAERGRTWSIKLTKTNYPTVCEDDFANCQAPEMCTGSNLLHCQATCRNYTTCSTDFTPCSFDNKLLGNWVEDSMSGNRLIKVQNKTAYLDKLDTYECFGIYSSTHDGLKPVVKILDNGCKPRYACLDMEYFTSSIVKYRISQSIPWPFKENLVRGDICRESLFEDDHYPFSFAYRSQNHRILVKATEPTGNSARGEVECNLPYGMRFRTRINGVNCEGTLKICQSGTSIVFTYEAPCNMPQTRVFHKCLAEYKTHTQQYILTERTDHTDELYCWVFKEAITGTRNNIFLQMHSGDCTNDTYISLGGNNEKIPYIKSYLYVPSENRRNSDACLNIPSGRLSTSSSTIASSTLSSTISTSVARTRSTPVTTMLTTKVQAKTDISMPSTFTSKSTTNPPPSSPRTISQTTSESIKKTSSSTTPLTPKTTEKDNKANEVDKDGKSENEIIPQPVISSNGVNLGTSYIILLIAVLNTITFIIRDCPLNTW